MGEKAGLTKRNLLSLSETKAGKLKEVEAVSGGAASPVPASLDLEPALLNNDVNHECLTSIEGATLVKCKDCAELEPHNRFQSLCNWLGAYIRKRLISEPWECKGFKLKPKPRRRKSE